MGFLVLIKKSVTIKIAMFSFMTLFLLSNVALAEEDVSSIIGTVPAYLEPQLTFSAEEGLLQVHIAFASKGYDQVEEGLTGLLGQPSPVIYELMNNKDESFKRTEWRTGKNTRVILQLGFKGASVEIIKQNAALLGGEIWRQIIAAAMLEQGEEYSKNLQIVEASSIYQTLLNSTDSYQFFTQTAQQYLAAYSSLEEAVDYLAKDGEFTFYGFKNISSDYSEQKWVRIELSPAAQAKLANISAVLCRVRAIPGNDTYSVVEQIWLDGSNQIIGGSPPSIPQDTDGPAPYIKQVCETFLQNWFTPRSSMGAINQ